MRPSAVLSTVQWFAYLFFYLLFLPPDLSSASSSRSISLQPQNSTTNTAVLSTINGQRNLFDQIAHSLQFDHYSDWYKIRRDQFLQKARNCPTGQTVSVVRFLEDNYGNNIVRALLTVYPNNNWQAWQFEHLKPWQEYWRDRTNQRKFMDYVGDQLNIHTLDDWYNISLSSLSSIKGTLHFLKQSRLYSFSRFRTIEMF